MTTINHTIMDAMQADIKKLASGDKPAHLRFALQSGRLSALQRLGFNGDLSLIVGDYVTSGLPDRDTLYSALSKVGGVVFGAHLDSLYYVEMLDKTGKLDPIKYFPDGYTNQVEWRDRAYELLTGHGWSWKTISMAALIYAPETSELVPIDRHVIARRGYRYKSSPQSRSTVLRIEQEMMLERDAAGFSHMPLMHWHWYKWEEWRQMTGASTSDTCESHEKLSCRSYK